jgi:lactam utilization protein B
LDKTLQKIDDIIKQSPVVKGITAVSGTLFVTGKPDFASYNAFVREQLKSRFIMAISVYSKNLILSTINISQDLRQFASMEEFHKFIITRIPGQLINRSSPQQVRELDEKLKNTVIEFIQSRDWEVKGTLH